MIGKVVDGVVDVTVNGNKLNSQAITIDGTSYLPVRDIGNVLGLKVDYDTATGVIVNTPSTDKQDKIKELGEKSREIFEERKKINDTIILPYEIDNGKPKDDDYYGAKKKIDEMTTELNDIYNKLQEISKQK
ncbi:hypothetical protein CF651_22880 [Paenibacillus rigui]|uniref:Copper amine oxidase-like N-terminal domain-containing protein n=2 Tax=Paenibacillus rigui TaxID=554312 RepID=A0A229UKR8_9BACL|nr:hypothetical protein CF651_22880 [Paenibacillus rigui]